MDCKCNSFSEATVTIPLSHYTEMVRLIQMLEDTLEIERLKSECEATEAKRVEVLHKMFALQNELEAVKNGNT